MNHQKEFARLGYKTHCEIDGKTFMVKKGKVTSAVVLEANKDTFVLNGTQIERLLKGELPMATSKKKTVSKKKATTKAVVKKTTVPVKKKAVVKKAVTPAKKTASVKSRVRAKLLTGKKFSIDGLVEQLNATAASVKTAVSDLKSVKYCGKEGPLKIVSAKNRDKVTVYSVAA